MFYTIPTKTADSLFKLGGFPKTFRANINTFGETCLMIRSPAVEIISFLEKTDYNKPVVRYVLCILYFLSEISYLCLVYYEFNKQSYVRFKMKFQ